MKRIRLKQQIMSGFNNHPFPVPFGLVVLQGNYTVSNYSTATPLIIYDPSSGYMGTRVIRPTSYSFQPISDLAVVEGGSYSSSSGDWMMQYEIGVQQYWPVNESATSTNFKPGVYTVVARDEWGALVVVHFTVSK
jgi:hypothetical protein